MSAARLSEDVIACEVAKLIELGERSIVPRIAVGFIFFSCQSCNHLVVLVFRHSLMLFAQSLAGL